MSPLVFAGLVPHPPLLIEGVGDELKAEVADTDAAYRRLAAQVTEQAPDTVIIISPHGPVFSDAYTMADWPRLEGDFTPFGSTVAMAWDNHRKYVARAARLAEREGLPLIPIGQRQLASHRQSASLDHGTMVPLYYLKQAGWQGTIACVRIGGIPPAKCYRIGTVLARAAENDRVAVLASGDLSHCLTSDGPSPYNPAGKEFDQAIVAALKAADFRRILDLPPDLRQRAAECGWRPLVTLLGTLDGYDVSPEVLSYQGPFGVGYLVAALAPGQPGHPGLAPAPRRPRDNSPHTRLARQAIAHFLATGEILTSDADLGQPAGAFVSLKADDQLRGCIGTIEPARDSLAAEIIANAIDAATRDPRFDPVTPKELDSLTITVDVLDPVVPAAYADLDPSCKGVVVEWQGRRGLLLPDLPGIDDASQQLAIAMEKAGIPQSRAGDVRIYTFSVERYD